MKIKFLAVPVLLASTTSAFAALPAEVATSISAAQTDVLAMIGQGFAYVGAIVGLMTVLAVFAKIIRKGKG